MNSESTPIIDCAGTSSLTTQKSITTETATPEEQIETAHATLTAALRADLLDRIKAASPAFFEQLIVDLLVALGYGGGREEMGRALGKSGDGGVDGIIKEDALGLDVVYIQAKRYTTGAVGRPEVQGFAGSLAGFKASKGVFVTTSRFAASAKEYVDRIQARIVLIDGDELTRLLVKHNVGVRVRDVYQVKKVDEDYFDTEI
ncbi:MAG: restriction endonuclease [Rhodospirillaceae bacterium]